MLQTLRITKITRNDDTCFLTKEDYSQTVVKTWPCTEKLLDYDTLMCKLTFAVMDA